MAYKYLDNAVKSIEYQLNSAYSHGYSDGKEDARIEYLKEAWACDLGAKSSDKQIPCKPEEYVPDFPYNIFSTQKCAKCGTPVIGKKNKQVLF